MCAEVVAELSERPVCGGSVRGESVRDMCEEVVAEVSPSVHVRGGSGRGESVRDTCV